MLISVLIDTTPPVASWIRDGLNATDDMMFSSETSTKPCNWDPFSDPESEIANYQVKVVINQQERITVELDNHVHSFKDHSITMNHLDKVQFTLEGQNGAGLKSVVNSDGFIVDHTPPVLEHISDHRGNGQYQSTSTELNLQWKYHDSDSGIKYYQYSVIEVKHGSENHFWPQEKRFIRITDPSVDYFTSITGLTLSNGVMYKVNVIAINKALLSTSHMSAGVIVDTTAPIMLQVCAMLLHKFREFLYVDVFYLSNKSLDLNKLNGYEPLIKF